MLQKGFIIYVNASLCHKIHNSSFKKAIEFRKPSIKGQDAWIL